MERTERGFRLSSGREVNPYLGIIGIAKHPEGWFVGGGYDDVLTSATVDAFEPENAWTPDERRELADYMIALWTEFRNSTTNGT